VKVGESVSHTTVTDSVVIVEQPAAAGLTFSVMVTMAGLAGHVKTGEALVGSLKVPAVALHAYVAGAFPAVAVAARAIVDPTVVSVGDADSELMFAHTLVVALTDALPASGTAPAHESATWTAVAPPDEMEKLAEPAQVSVPSVDVAVSTIVYPLPEGKPPI
jgi:hypothetical protein